MHDALFARQRELSVADLKTRAHEIGLDGESFDACLDGGETRSEVEAGLVAGQRAGVRGTPWLYVNGRPVQFVRGVPLVDQLRKVIDDELDG
jgi:protein-disulfide isomerase